MQYSNFTPPQQDILVTTIHYQESVLEIYLNGKKKTITELKHSSNHRVSVHQHSLEDYLKQKSHIHGLEKKISNLFEISYQ